MARYAAEQIYAFARAAGFDPDQAVTMTAIALAESGGRSGAHNPHGEDSRGLWQINVRAHGDMGLDLYDPRDNAVAAFQVSHGGRDISLWTTAHGGSRAPYVRFRAEAQAAAVAHGDPAGLGMWQGTRGYGDVEAAGAPSGHHSASQGVAPAQSTTTGSGDVTTTTSGNLIDPAQQHGVALDPTTPDPMTVPSPDVGDASLRHGVLLEPRDPLSHSLIAHDAGDLTGMAGEHPGQASSSTVERFVDAALAQRGDAYVMGANARLDDPNPRAFDCAELVRWAAHRAGVDVPDGSWLQYLAMKREGRLIPVEQAIHTRGALLFSFSTEPTPGGARPSHSHVAISLGEHHQTIEARGAAYGVNEFEASRSRFQYAALPPGSPGGSAHHASRGSAHAEEVGGPSHAGGHLLDTDVAGGADALTRRMRLDPFHTDTSPDRLHDSVGLLFDGHDPTGPDGLGSAWSPESDDALLAAAQSAHGVPLDAGQAVTHDSSDAALSVHDPQVDHDSHDPFTSDVHDPFGDAAHDPLDSSHDPSADPHYDPWHQSSPAVHDPAHDPFGDGHDHHG